MSVFAKQYEVSVLVYECYSGNTTSLLDIVFVSVGVKQWIHLHVVGTVLGLESLSELTTA